MSDNFRPISESASSWGVREEGVTRLTEDDHDQIAELLMGKTVVKVDDEHLLLSDGTVLKAIGHEGGCACSAGDYDLTELNGVDNIITSVEFDDHPAGDGDPWGDELAEHQKCEHGPGEDKYTGHYRIWVYAENQKINLMTVEGSDGNGYYGTGYGLLVRRVQP